MVGIRPLFLVILTLALLPASAAAGTDTQIIVKRDSGLTAAERADIRADAGVRFVENLPLPSTEVVSAKPDDVADAVRDLNADPDVVYAERDRQVSAFAAGLPVCAPSGSNPCLWGVARVFGNDPDAAWVQSTGAARTVAVVDSGVDAAHPDLVGQVAAGWDWVEGDADPQDQSGHGTHVAGTIAADRENGEGVIGVAPDARIVPLRVLDGTGTGRTSDVVAAFDWAGDKGISVVNASLGAEGFLQSEYDAIKAHPDTLFVVAAGNAGKDNDDPATATYPCAYGVDNLDRDPPAPALNNILCVGASDKNDARASFSNYGVETVDVYAPGVDIVSTKLGDLYKSSGTSMAAPHVAGAAALVAARNPWLNAVELKDAILDSAEPVSAGPRLNALAPLAFAPDDADGDGDLEPADNCPTAYNPDQADQDLDGTGDACADGAPAIDRDGDLVNDDADQCPDENWPGADGCPLAAVTASDDDHDGVSNAQDACPGTPVAGGLGCPDNDDDRVADGRDNCPTVWNPSQRDLDGDGAGDACDSTPRGDDADGDGKPRLDDACPADYGTLANGCPGAAPQAFDSDRDGVADSSDPCPSEANATKNGCPLAEVASLSARAKRRTAKVRITTTRLAMVTITVERKKGRRWVRVARRTAASFQNRATLTVKRLKRGKHRVRVSISSSAGTGTSVSKTFRVR